MWCWRRLLRVLWTAKRSNQSILREIGPEYSLEGLMLKLKHQYFDHLMRRTDSLEKTLMLGKTEGGRRGPQGWDGWMASPTRWPCVLARSGSWWWTGKPGVLQSVGSQKVEHDWTELNWQHVGSQFPIMDWTCAFCMESEESQPLDHQGSLKVECFHDVLVWTKFLFSGEHQEFKKSPLKSLGQELSIASSVQFSCSVVSNFLQPHGLQHARLPSPSPTSEAYSNSCPSSRWCHPTISSSVLPSSSRLQSFSTSGAFPMSQFFASGGQSIGVSASVSVLPMNIQDWFPLGLTGWISLQSKRLSRVFSNTSSASILQCSAFFIVQLSHLYMTTGKTIALTRWTFVSKVRSLLFNMLSRLVIPFLPRSKHLLISWLQSTSAVILEPPKIKPLTVSIVSPPICHEVMEPGVMILVLWMLSFKPTFSLSSFTFTKRLFSSSSLSAIRVVSSAYLRLLLFFPAILIPACASSSPAFLMMYSA